MQQPWTSESILTLARGFMEPRILLTAVELDLFTLLAVEPRSVNEIAEKTGAQKRALTILLDALSAMGLLIKQEDTYVTEPSAVLWLDSKSPETTVPMILHANNLWERWGKLSDTVRPDRPHEQESDLSLASFIGAMHVVGAPQAAKIVMAVQPGMARKLLDIGGASGTYTIAFLKVSSQLQATLFDRVEVVEMARERLQIEGLSDRVTLVGGDFYQDSFPPGHDLAFLSAIIHQNSPEQNLDLYQKIYKALIPGGRLVIRDHVLSPDRLSPRSGALFAINMLVGTAGGNSYTFEDITEGLTKAGYERIRLIQPDQRMDGLVEAFRPED
jgi:predicted O-methyltransferase YrrM